MDDWDWRRARELYSISHWGEGYFDIDADGQMCALPTGSSGQAVSLREVVEKARRAGLGLPLLVRFTDILEHRAGALCAAFREAMSAHDYHAAHHAIYPIKVNQQRSVVQHIVDSNDAVGLEAGSKPELLAVLAQSRANGVVICNGYKDREYVLLALAGQHLGLRVFLVVEKLNELPMILSVAREMGIRPCLGIRLRLASLGKGNWQNTGGEKAKFGLSAGQLLQAVALLHEAGMGECLKLVHFHMGSQISNLRDIRAGLREAARYYVELHKLDLNIEFLDVGGGLGVDYQGTRSRAFCSMNYTLDEYADAVVRTIQQVCDAAEVPLPALITESGRAMSAHHAVLITNVTAVEPAGDHAPVEEPNERASEQLKDLWAAYQALDFRPVLECYQTGRQLLADGHQQFVEGRMGLEQRVQLESLHLALCRAVRDCLRDDKREHRETLDELKARLADKYFCNFSLFQSVPDVWAINQIFPIVPLTRLDERPTRRAVIEDLTCDSDGRIDLFVDSEGVESTLPVHAMREGENYLLGLFLVGAYQETLGDIHNLFGDTDTVNVAMRPDGFHLSQAIRGDDTASVLALVGYREAQLWECLREKMDVAGMDRVAREVTESVLRDALNASTYLT